MTWLDTGLLAGAVITAAALGWQFKRSSKKSNVNTPVKLPPQIANNNRPSDQLPILSAIDLLDQTKTQGLVERIRSNLGYSPDNFEQDVRPLLHNFAEFVQLLPASQSHHHAHPGGLLEHLLEVGTFALTKRQGYRLPLGAGVEDQLVQGPLWSYAILIGALLHDIGKPVSDVKVTLYGANPSQAIGQWSGLAGSMLHLHGSLKATHYSLDFPEQVDYKAHGKLSSSLLHALVPASGMAWLGTQPKLLDQLNKYLNDQSAADDPVTEIIKFADMTSVSENLKSGSRRRFANARITPLIEQLMDGLKQVVLGGHLAMNKPGAALYIDPDGQHLWIVAGLAADKVREVLESGSKSSIPKDNARLFDTWQEFGACLAPPPEFGKGAVWWVQLNKTDPPWTMVLTMLKFLIRDIYTGSVPDVFAGTIVPTSPNAERPKTQIQLAQEQSDALVAGSVVPDAQIDSSLAQPVVESAENTIGWPAEGNSSWPESLDQLKQPNVRNSVEEEPLKATTASVEENAAMLILSQPPVPVEQSNFLDELDAAVAKSPPTEAPKRAVQAMPTSMNMSSLAARKRGADALPRINADAFMAWLQTGLGDGSIIYNESEAFVHFVDAGLLLLSPKSIKNYLETNQYVGSVSDSKGTLQALQRELQKSGYLAFNKETKTHFHQYQVKQEEKDRKRSKQLTCYLIPNPSAYIRPVPAQNPLLEKVNLLVPISETSS